MFTGHDNSNTRADLHLLIHGLPLRSAGGKDAAHFPAVTRGEELQTCAGIISQECSCPQPSCCYLLGRGRRDRQQNLLLFRDTSASTLSREQLLDSPLCNGLEQEGSVDIDATHWPSLSPDHRSGRGKRISDPGPKLVEEKRASEGKLLPPLPVRQEREAKKVKDRLFLLIKAGQILGTPGSSFTYRHKKLCSIWSFSEALG